MNASKSHPIIISVVIFLATAVSVGAQLRRPQYLTVKKAQPKSKLTTESGAVYLDGLTTSPVKLKTTVITATYSDLDGKRWIGNIEANQDVILLAISEKAYRVRGKANQGQIAGWVRKDALSNMPKGLEEKLVQLKQRHDLIRELIDNNQVAIGMTPEEVTASIGPPDSKLTETNESGSITVFEYISYTRTPQDFIHYNQFGVAIAGVRYVEIETGRLTIQFTKNLASSISESEGINVTKPLSTPIPPIVQFR